MPLHGLQIAGVAIVGVAAVIAAIELFSDSSDSYQQQNSFYSWNNSNSFDSNIPQKKEEDWLEKAARASPKIQEEGNILSREEWVMRLIEMGFNKIVCLQALELCGDFDLALDYLLQKEIDQMSGALPLSADATIPGAFPLTVEATMPGELPLSVEATMPEELPLTVEATMPGELPLSVEATMPGELPLSVEATMPGELPLTVEATTFDPKHDSTLLDRSDPPQIPLSTSLFVPSTPSNSASTVTQKQTSESNEADMISYNYADVVEEYHDIQLLTLSEIEIHLQTLSEIDSITDGQGKDSSADGKEESKSVDALESESKSVDELESVSEGEKTGDDWDIVSASASSLN